MSASNTFETNVLKLVYQAVAWANIADDAASAPDANIAIALMTADPGEAGNMGTNEISYTNYARVNVARTTGGWSESSGTVNPAAAITFAQSGGGTGGTVTHFATGRPSGGAAIIHVSGTVTPNITVNSGVTPQLSTATAITCD